MFDTIVWATDGSENALRALPYAAALARATGGRVVAVHCREMVLAPGRGFPVLVDDDRVVAQVHEELGELEEAGIETDVRIVQALASHAAEAIAEEARALRADAIVVGTRGHGPVTGLVAGSVTQRLLHAAPCPVLAVPTGRRAAVLAAAAAGEEER